MFILLNLYQGIGKIISMKKVNFSLILVVLPLVLLGQGIKIQSGTNLVANAAVNIVISGDGHWTNNGSFNPDQSTVSLTGDVDQYIQGSSVSDFYNLTINKSAGDARLDADATVANTLSMTSGQLDLQNSSIDLGTTGSIQNETETNRIKVSDITNHTGTIQATKTINSVTDYNPANLGVLISTNVNLGTITVVRGHQVQNGSGSFAGNGSIARYFEVPNVGQLDANDKVKMQYWNAELNGHAESELIQYQWVSESSQAWWTPLTGAINTSTNTYDPADDPYSDYFGEPNWYTFDFTETFTLGSESSPLPVEWLSFEGYCHGGFVNLEWETASEINNDFFIVERSADGENFKPIGTVEGNGNTNQIHAYSFFDTKPLGQAYYRLKQVDFNGDYDYSETVYAACNEETEPVVRLFPNPFTDQLHVMVSDLPEAVFSLEVFSIDGKLIEKHHLKGGAEGFHKILHLENLVPAMYFVRITSGDYVKTYKAEKQ
jgi:hypothetical protein